MRLPSGCVPNLIGRHGRTHEGDSDDDGPGTTRGSPVHGPGGDGSWPRARTRANGIPTGYVSQVVFRYGKEQPGTVVTYADVKDKKRGSACWAGTDTSDVTILLEVRKVSVQGTTGPTKGTAAWTSTTQDYWKPMERTSQGILGAQDVPFCAHP